MYKKEKYMVKRIVKMIYVYREWFKWEWPDKKRSKFLISKIVKGCI